MKIITVIRVHGYMKNLIPSNAIGSNATATVIKTDNQDDKINKIMLDNPDCMVNVETVYDDKIGLLFDIVYIQVDDSYNPDDDDGDDDDDHTPSDDVLRSILKNSKRHDK